MSLSLPVNTFKSLHVIIFFRWVKCPPDSSNIVIPKENKDPTNPASYRPIALLDLLSTLLANRLKSFIQEYIMPDQIGFIPQHHLKDNIHCTLNSTEYAKKSKLESIILAVNIEKVFSLL